MNTFRNILVGSLLFFASCESTKRAVYFSEGQQRLDSTVTVAAPVIPETRIQPDDILAINVTSISSLRVESDPVSIYREGGTPQGSSVAGRALNTGSTSANMGFQVDEIGNIEYPVLGKVNVKGKTVREVKELLSTKLGSYVKSPVVEVRITNFKISVVGEVKLPGFIIAPNQRISILEALAAAGDISLGGRKDNIMVIRQEGGRQEIGYIDLTRRTAFQSPYYYLKQNDIVNVSPSDVRRQEANIFTRVYLPVFTQLLTAALAVYGIVQISRR